MSQENNKGDGNKMPAILKIKSQSQSLLDARQIAQEQMKKKGIKYSDVLKVVERYKNDR